MIFNFSNIGIVESAEIELKGLTVLTGLNDTGKSFLSKTIYSIIKTVTESKEQAVFERFELINNNINQAFSLHRQFVPFTPQKLQSFNPSDISNKILNYLLQQTPEQEVVDYVSIYFNKIIEDLNINADRNINLKNNTNNILTTLNGLLEKIVIALKDEGDDEKKYKRYFDNAIISKLFQGQINSLVSKNSTLKIKVTEGVTELLNINVKNNKTLNFKIENILLKTDATFIETPIIVQLASFITSTLAFPKVLKKIYQQRTELPYHLIDLVEKINSPTNIPETYHDIFNGIKKLIDGQLTFKINERRIVFEKNDGTSIQTFNIASGIKSLGIIQLLLSGGTINQNTILIIDEPEVHLHPKWEVEYAKIIVALSKIGIPILISSHSPYLLQAIPYFVDKYETQNITKIYYGEKCPEKRTSVFKDVTEDLEPVFKAIAKPMQDLL